MIAGIRDFLFSIEGVVVLVGWIVLLSRFNITFRHGLHRPTSAVRLARLIWLLFLFIVLAGTVHHPMVSQWLAATFGAWFARVPRVVFAVGAYMMTAEACYRFAPSLRPKRWHWPAVLGILTILSHVFMLVVFEYGSSKLAHSAEYYWEYAADPLFHYYILRVAAIVVLPALALARRREEQAPMRLRFALMSGTHIAVMIWMLNDTVADLGTVVGFSYNPDLVYRLSILLFASTFLFSYFMPADHFVRLVRLSAYLSDLATFLPIRVLQLRTAAFLARPASGINLRRLLREPGTMVYQGVIDILDSRKALKLRADEKAKAFGALLDPVAQPDLSYPQVVDRLRALGWREIKDRLPLPSTPLFAREAHA